MSRLKVAIVAPSLRILGGHSVQASELLAGWKNDPEVDAWLVPIDPEPPRALRAGTRVKYLRTLLVESTYVPRLAREMMRADVIHVFSASYWSFLLAPAPAVLLGSLLGKPVVLNYHSGEAPDHLKRSRIARAILRLADARVVPSRFLVDVFRTFGLDAIAVSNIVDQRRFTFRTRSPLRPRLLSTRNLAYPYNVACTVRAFQHVQARVPEATLTIVGDGPDAPALRALIADLGLRGVQCLGRIEPDRMPQVYADHDLYVQSPDIDNMPLSVLEAFASGLPVVSTDVGGIRAILEPGAHGLLAPADDDRAIADRIVWMLEHADEARSMAQAAHDTLQTFTWPAVRSSWLEIYRRVLDKHVRTAAPVQA